MKNLISILFLIISIECYSQQLTSETASKSIIHYIDLNVGKIISDGECWDLVGCALYDVVKKQWSTNSKWTSTFPSARPNVSAREIDETIEKVQPGDIIYFISKFPTSGHVCLPMHWAFIYEVLPNNIYRIAHQSQGMPVTIEIVDFSKIKNHEKIYSIGRPTLTPNGTW